MAAPQPTVLVVVVDASPLFWGQGQHQEGFTLAHTVNQLIVFAKAFLMLHPHNEVVFIAAHSQAAAVVYPRAGQTWSSSRVHTDVVAGMQAAAAQCKPPLGPSKLSAALSLALCHVNRVKQRQEEMESRVLVASVSEDHPPQYIPIMNAIFSAQKLGTMIDVVNLGLQEPMFLQQAAHITDGIYYRVHRSDRSLLQYLLMVFLPDRHAREMLCMPQETEINLRAACFCHHNVVDTGFVCSVCLSVFCEFVPICSTCGARFSFARTRKRGRDSEQSHSNGDKDKDKGKDEGKDEGDARGGSLVRPSLAAVPRALGKK